MVCLATVAGQESSNDAAFELDKVPNFVGPIPPENPDLDACETREISAGLMYSQCRSVNVVAASRRHGVEL